VCIEIHASVVRVSVLDFMCLFPFLNSHPNCFPVGPPEVPLELEVARADQGEWGLAKQVGL